jgi:hypothetical protein
MDFELLQFPENLVRFAVVYEPKLVDNQYEEKLHIFRENYISTPKDYYGWNNNNSYFHCGTTIDANWDLFWTSDPEPKPIIDHEWALEYLHCPPNICEASLVSDASKYIKRATKKAAYKSGNVWKVYSYVVDDLVYYGITSREFKTRLNEHIYKLTKEGKSVLNEKGLYTELDQQTARGIEQMFISYHKLVGGGKKHY